MPRALETHANPPPELPRSRLRPRNPYPSNIQLQTSPQKLLTVAENERLLRGNLPTELWKEVMRHTTSIEHEFETCGFDGRNYTFEHSESYKAEWLQAFQTRLSLVLVCKTWNSLASEFLYRSILIDHAYSAREFVQRVPRLVKNGMINYVRRVSVYLFNCSKALKLSVLKAIAQFPNLRVLEIKDCDTFTPEARQTHITTLRARFKEWSAFKTLASFPHLQYLQFSFNDLQPVTSRVKLSQLKTLHVESYPPDHRFYEWLDLPALHTLIIGHLYGTDDFPLIQHFLPHIRAFGIDFLMALTGVLRPPNNASAPHLASLICRRPGSMSLQDISHVVPLKSIEEIHVSLEKCLLGLAIRPSDRYGKDDHMWRMFAHMEDETVMQKLSYVYTDLTINTLHVLKPGMKKRLRKWLTIMKNRGVMVMTHIKPSKYASHRYYALEDIWDAEPHWEFWASNDVGGCKWDVLASATGRKKMTWKVSNNGSECQWYGTA